MIVAEWVFPSEPLESQHNLPVPPYFPSTKLEMILIHKELEKKKTEVEGWEGAGRSLAGHKRISGKVQRTITI